MLKAGKATGCQFLFWPPLTEDQSWSSKLPVTDRELSKAPHITINTAMPSSLSDSFLEGTLPNMGGCTERKPPYCNSYSMCLPG